AVEVGAERADGVLDDPLLLRGGETVVAGDDVEPALRLLDHPLRRHPAGGFPQPRPRAGPAPAGAPVALRPRGGGAPAPRGGRAAAAGGAAPPRRLRLALRTVLHRPTSRSCPDGRTLSPEPEVGQARQYPGPAQRRGAPAGRADQAPPPDRISPRAMA